MAEHVVIVPADEYEHLVEQKALLDQLFKMAAPAYNNARALNVKETVALSFMDEFDPSRADEWGHISYCFTNALRLAIVVAGQEARR